MKNKINIAIIIVISGLINFLITFILLTSYGATDKLDSYFLAITIPQVLLSIFVYPLSGIVLSYLVEIDDDRKNNCDSQRFIYVISIAILSIFLALISYFILRIISLYITIDDVLYELFLYSILSIPSFFLLNSFLVVYHSKSDFISYEKYNLLGSSYVVFVLLYYQGNISIISLPLIILSKNLLVSFFMIKGLTFKKIYRHDFKFILEVSSRAKALILSSSITKLEPFIERSIITSSGHGNMSIFYFTQQLYMFLVQLVNKSYTATKVPFITKKIICNESFSEIYINVKIRTFLFLLCLSCFLSIFLYFFSYYGFSFKKLNSENIDSIICFSLFVFFISLFNLLRDYIYTLIFAFNRTDIVSYIDISSFLIFNLLKFIVFYLYGLQLFLICCVLQSFFKFYISNYFVKKAIHDKY